MSSMLDTALLARDPQRIQAGLSLLESVISHRAYPLAIGAALTLGIIVRASRTLSTDFPLNDGGLFYAMVRDLQDSHYHLPAFSSYNSAQIPFAYPPLGFYAAGILADYSALSLFDALRWLPLAATTLAVGAFFLLARAMLKSAPAVVAATFAFALVPRSFLWLLMGGGLTRSLGFLFAILALWQVYLLYTRREARFVLPATVFCALTVLSHLETGQFLASSIALFFLFHGRHRHGVVCSAVVAIGTLAFTAPWWVSVLAYHDVGPFLAASATGGSVFQDGESRLRAVNLLASLFSGETEEPLFPVIGTLGLLGALGCVAQTLVPRAGERPALLLVPVWWATIAILDVRAFATFATLPAALLAGIGLTEILLPTLSGLLRDLPALRSAAIRTGPDFLISATSSRRSFPRWLVAMLGLLLCYTTLSALIRRDVLIPVPADERAAMRWIAQETPPASRFLVVSGISTWQTDGISEWFPVLADRTSVTTVQGYEWIQGGGFARRAEAHMQLQTCANREATCLDRSSQRTETPSTHVYVSKWPATLSGGLLANQGGNPASGKQVEVLSSLAQDPRYSFVYDGPGAAVFARRY